MLDGHPEGCPSWIDLRSGTRSWEHEDQTEEALALAGAMSNPRTKAGLALIGLALAGAYWASPSEPREHAPMDLGAPSRAPDPTTARWLEFLDEESRCEASGLGADRCVGWVWGPDGERGR